MQAKSGVIETANENRRNKQPIRKVRVQKEGGEFAANFCRRIAADSTLSTSFRFRA
jgi:hypothetical protein